MSYPTDEYFDTEIIRRTQKLLQADKSTEYDFTLLINCLLGLLILPKEFCDDTKNAQKKNIFNIKIMELPNNIKNIFSKEEVSVCIDNDQRVMNKCLLYKNGKIKKVNTNTFFFTVLRYLRNAVAHCNITPVKFKNNEDWEGIILKDNYKDSKTKIIVPTIQIYLKQKEIKLLIDFIVSKYMGVDE